MHSAQHKLLIRHAILLQLAAAAPVPLPRSTLMDGLRIAGHQTDEQSLSPHLDYLEQKQYLQAVRSELSAADIRYRLHAIGRDYLEANGLL